MSGFRFEGNDFDYGRANLDGAMRSAAFEEIHRLSEAGDVVTAAQLKQGFQFRGARVPFVNPQRGIFKPHQMPYLLSIKTVIPRHGGQARYEDQRRVHDQIYSGDISVSYSFMGDDPEAADNRWLHDAMLHQIPVVYFLGVSPGRYKPLLPAFVVDFKPAALSAEIAFGVSEFATKAPQSVDDRRYAIRTVKQRLHQATFREMVSTAYSHRCAISGLPEPRLLDAAHIMEDRNERLGQPVIGNGIMLSKIHHAAFDAHLIGIDPDYTIRVSRKLLDLRDGPTLEALRKFDGKKLREPRQPIDRPDPARLAARFELFKSAA